MDLENKLLLWLSEELKEKESRPIPIHLLLVRLAVDSRGEADNTDLTQSTVLSFETFDKARLFQHLRSLEQQGLIEFTNEHGKGLDDETKPASGFLKKLSEGPKEPEYLVLTSAGREQLAEL